MEGLFARCVVRLPTRLWDHGTASRNVCRFGTGGVLAYTLTGRSMQFGLHCSSYDECFTQMGAKHLETWK
eukprot:6055533-Lingulodinium_polyedra.AAC.1